MVRRGKAKKKRRGKNRRTKQTSSRQVKKTDKEKWTGLEKGGARDLTGTKKPLTRAQVRPVKGQKRVKRKKKGHA